MAPPPNMKSCMIVGRFSRSTVEGGPSEPVVGMTVTLTARLAPARVKNVASGSPVTIFLDPMQGITNDNGVLTTRSGSIGFPVVPTDDPDNSPTGWTYLVTLSKHGVTLGTYSIFAPAGTKVDLTTAIPVPASPGAEMSAWQSIVAQVNAARDEAVSAATYAREPGPPNVLRIGTVTSAAQGAPAVASITGVSPSQELNLTLPRGEEGPPGPQWDATVAEAEIKGFIETGTPREAVEQVARESLPSYLGARTQDRIDTQAGYRKRIVHNLVYRHADYDAANAKPWGGMFPQAFTIDETAREIITIGNEGLVSVYDWDSGAYKGIVFRLEGGVSTNQSLVIRYIDGRRYMYARKDNSAFARWDITTYPAKLAELVPESLYPIETLTDFAYWDGIWTIGARQSDYVSHTYSERGKFFRYDDDFEPIGMLHIDTMRYGGPGGGGLYGGSGFPKSQGFAAGPGTFAATVGGGWAPDRPVPSDQPYSYQGIRAYSASGDVIAESLVTAGTMFDWFTDLGYQPTHIETEGIVYAFGKYHSLYAINSGSTPGARTGGFVIVEEFSAHEDAHDLSDKAVSWTSPDSQKASVGLHPRKPDGMLANLVTYESLTTIPQIFDYMRSVGQQRLAFYAGDSRVKAPDGTPLTRDALIECVTANATALQVRVTNSKGSSTSLYWHDGSGWVWSAGDSGWVDIALTSGFSPIAGEQPQSRVKDGVVYLRGGIMSSGLSTMNLIVIGTLAVAFRPTQKVQGAVGASTGASIASGIVQPNGHIEVRTGSVVGSYYGLGSLGPWLVD